MIEAVTTSGEFYPHCKSTTSHYDPKTFTCAEEAVAELLTHATTSNRPGMLLGKVQSGKTRTNTSEAID